LVVTGCAALLIWGIIVGARPAPLAKPNPNGAYPVTLAGNGHGSGKAIVAAKKVKIDGTMDDGHGNLLTLSAPKLALDNSTYRFTGTGTLNADPVNISGRIDPPDGTLKRWRVTATFVTTDGKCAGRVLGER